MAGLQLLIERCVSQVKDIETHVAEIDTNWRPSQEASRLLEEEGLSKNTLPPLGDKKSQVP